MANYFECCEHCTAPKRHPGCGKDCKEYKIAKIKYELERRWKRREHLKKSANVSPALRKLERREFLKKK